jgi:hypothetical protein
MYIELKRDSCHAAVRKHHEAQKRTSVACKEFERLRYSQEGLRRTRADLIAARAEVEKAMRLYTFISDVSASRGKVITPCEGNKHEERWRSGKIHGENPPTADSQVHKVELDGGIPAMEAVFLRPLNTGRLSRIPFNIGASEHYVKFRSTGGEMASRGNRGAVHEWQTFEVDDSRIIIVGWSVSCSAATQKTTVVESAGGILEEFVTLKITDSPNLRGDERWHCRVTFVYEAEYFGFLTWGCGLL